MKEFIITEKQDLQEIADAIRGKTGKTATMTVLDMAAEIIGIEVNEPVNLDEIAALIGGSALGGNEGTTTYADQLYQRFDVDKAVYPYVAIDVLKGEWRVNFSKTITFDGSFMRMYNYIWWLGDGLDLDYTDVDLVANFVLSDDVSKSGQGTLNDYCVLYQDSEYRYHYTNFENQTPDDKVVGKYRLDQ